MKGQVIICKGIITATIGNKEFELTEEEFQTLQNLVSIASYQYEAEFKNHHLSVAWDEGNGEIHTTSF